MKAAVYYNNSDVRIQEIDKPAPGPGELLVRIRASGICGSDVLEWYRIKKAPIVLGHEIAGDIVEVGEGVEGFSVGDRVTVSHHVPCNECRYCLHGNHTVCETLHTTNFDPGGFTEYVRIPEINVRLGTFALAEKMSYDEGTFVEPLGCVARGQRMARLEPWQTILVMGSGISGLLHIMLAKHRGSKRIIATDISKSRLDTALKFGADHVIPAGESVPSELRKLNNGLGADMVIVCTGAASAIQQAVECVDRAGTILYFATADPEFKLQVPINSFWRNSIKLMTSYAAAPVDLQEAVNLIGTGGLDINPMITHRLPLDEAGEAFRLMATGEESLKVIINP